MELNPLKKKDHLRIIPVKFGDNPPSGLGDVVYSKLLTVDG